MSHESYTQWWVLAKNRYQNLVQKDVAYVQATQYIKDRPLANLLLGGLYVKYARAVREIATCLDQIAHPQKRITIQTLYDSAAIRLRELNEELKKVDISEYHYVDGALIELKLVPKDIDVLDDFYPALGRAYNLQQLYNLIKNGDKAIYTPPPPVNFEENANNTTTEIPSEQQATTTDEATTINPQEDEEKSKKKKRPKKFVAQIVEELSPEEEEERRQHERISVAVKLIQVHERARQARLYFGETSDIVAVRKKLLLGEFTPSKEVDPSQRNSAATKIQRCWQRHLAREEVARRLAAKRLLIGMTATSWKSTKEFDVYQANLEKRRQFRDARIQEYIQANIDERARVFRVIGPRLMEDISDEIRDWFYDWYKKAKAFDKYPPENKGGTVLVVRGETLTPYQWIDEVERRRKEKKKSGNDKAKLEAEKKKKLEAEKKAKAKEKEKKKKALALKKKKARNFNEYEFEFEPTFATEVYKRGIAEHQKLWDLLPDDPEEHHLMHLITDEMCHEMQLEIRKQVDELMRLELELLEDALRRDKKKKGKKKKKKSKKGGRRKRKGKKDPTGDRTYEDLVQELVNHGIIRPYESRKLQEYKGDFSYANWEKRNLNFDPPTTLGDVRQVVRMNCVVPMTVQQSMQKHRSVLLVGCRQSGKKLLANAIFTETQCVLFDLSSEVLAGLYPGKQGMKMLVHLIQKLSRALQPSIIFFNKVERVFYKKVPKVEKELDPKRMSKVLFKQLVKTIQPQDRIMVLGITGQPWLAKQRQMMKAFERVILIPRPDYGSIFLYWRELLMPYHGVDRNFEVSPLALNTQYFPLAALKHTVDSVFTPQRIIELSYKPLLHMQLFRTLKETSSPITDKEFAKFQKWYKKTPTGKFKGLFMKWADNIRAIEAAQLEKAKAAAAKKKK